MSQPEATSSKRRSFLGRFSKETKEEKAQRKLPADLRDGYEARAPQAIAPAGTDAPGASAIERIKGEDVAAVPAPRNEQDSTVTNGPSRSTTESMQMRPPAPIREQQQEQQSSMASLQDFVLPDIPWLCGSWHVTHSTLPMWKDKRNVRITYTRLAGNKLDDLVTYQSHGSDKIQSVHGVDTSMGEGGWRWRGKGFLKITSSQWEVLGWGGGGRSGVRRKSTSAGDGDDDDKSEQWVVTYFAKTLFTPAGLDIYSRNTRGLSPRTLHKIKEALKKMDPARIESKGEKEEGGTATSDDDEIPDFVKLVDSIFEIKRDGTRTDFFDPLMMDGNAEHKSGS